MLRLATLRVLASIALATFVGCSGESTTLQIIPAESCMSCHNASPQDDYTGPGIENPHPFPGASLLKCTECHGGNGQGNDKDDSHVPRPPEIGDDDNLIEDRQAYFNRLTLTGIDKFNNYTVNGVTYSPIDYLQFVNPGDLRVVTKGRSCGQCHQGHVECVADSMLATSAGIFSGAMYAIGIDNHIEGNQGRYEDTAADLGFRAASDPEWVFGESEQGSVRRVLEFPVYSVLEDDSPDAIYRNDAYDSNLLANSLNTDNTVISGSPLANLYHEQVAFTCGDCHLGSAGANNRAGDYRSSGCTACHMQYSIGGRSLSLDPNVNKMEPLDPDDIEPPERSHVRSHRIRSIAKTLPDGSQIEGIDDYACAGCHQGSNRTVMQYWGIRLDQNENLRDDVQYPANPVSFQNTSGDERLFDPVARNRTFNGRDRDQYILFEDYDGDLRDDTPPDIHYEAGLGCIDCHGSFDLHGGDPANPHGSSIKSRMHQAVAIECESCHGSTEAYAEVQSGETYDGTIRNLAVDRKGNLIKHVRRETDGNYYLYSRLTGERHYVVQTRDTIVDNGKVHPFTGEPIYSPKASYAMGRADGDPNTGIGPQQTGGTLNGFSHGDNLSCVSCHASWTNTCIGCHLAGEYDENNNFSNITGERIAFDEEDADFVYQTPVHFQLGIGPKNKVEPITPNTEVFWYYEDRRNQDSQIFAFSDRNSGGNNPNVADYPSLGHNVMMPHSIRGKVDAANEGPRYCNACHLTDEGLANFGAEYDQLRTAMTSGTFAGLDTAFFTLLQEHIGLNPNNQLNSPLWVHMVAGLGSGLFLFDENGCPVNPLDTDERRVGCEDQAPADIFDINRAFFNLDRLVDENGVSMGSNNHQMFEPGVGPNLRDGSLNPNLSGPLGATLIQRLTDPTTGIVLDSWLDADGAAQGDADGFINPPPE